MCLQLHLTGGDKMRLLLPPYVQCAPRIVPILLSVRIIAKAAIRPFGTSMVQATSRFVLSVTVACDDVFAQIPVVARVSLHRVSAFTSLVHVRTAIIMARFKDLLRI